MLTYPMNQRANVTKTEYLYQRIRQDILSGQLAPGEKLPSKRALAEHLSISVITVERVYQELTDEGYLSARERSGFYVAAGNMPGIRPSAYAGEEQTVRSAVCSGEGQTVRPVVNSGEGQTVWPVVNSGQGQSVRSVVNSGQEQTARPVKFLEEERAAQPADRDEEQCILTMTRITRKILSEHADIMLLQPSRSGCAVLRNALAEYLLRYRGMHVQPEQIVIGSGAEYLYGLVVQLFGRNIIYGLEDPSYSKIRAVYEANGAHCEMLAMDRTGISEAALHNSAAGILHVTPFHSYPSGVTAQAAKRRSYIDWAVEREGCLIEDDYDSEFTFTRKPIETIYAMDPGGRVIYLNTFTKSLLPSVRIGYMVLPERLLARWQKKLGFYACTVPVLDQYVLAEMIKSGSFERHLNRIRHRYLREEKMSTQK